ncbi:hypothetical protein [Actinorugispora endophytica]|nr:hypothetical protein [Actinorugispora endophytica]
MGKVLLAMAAGYVLGRKKKAKMAAGLGMWLVLRRFDIKPQQLLDDLKKELSGLPVVDEIRGEAREELVKAARTATGAVVSQMADTVADSLNRRTERLLHPDDREEEPEEAGKEKAGKEPEGSGEEKPGNEAEAGEAEPERAGGAGDEPEEKARPAGASGRTGRRSGGTGRAAPGRSTRPRATRGSTGKRGGDDG